MKKRGPKAFTEEFRREAVRLAESVMMSIAQGARELGINVESLRGWRGAGRGSSDKGAAAGSGPSLEEENRRLRRENARLLEEREMLKRGHGAKPSSPRMHDEIRVHPVARPHLPRHDDVPDARGVEGRVVQVA